MLLDRAPSLSLAEPAASPARSAGCVAFGQRGIYRLLGSNTAVPTAGGVDRRAGSARALPGAACCLLQSADQQQWVLVECDAELAAKLVCRILKRPTPWIERSAEVPDSVQGAVGAIALAMARRVARHDVLGLAAVGPSARSVFSRACGPQAVAIDATLLVQAQAYRISVQLSAQPRPTSLRRTIATSDLMRMGELPLGLSVVVATGQIGVSTMQSIAVGDAYMPGDGWRVRMGARGVCGSVVLCGALAERGLPANLLDDGRIVLLEGIMSVEADSSGEPNRTEVDAGAASESHATPTADALADVVAEAAVVVRVELGSVTLAAREWASVRPGDILATGSRVAERAVLRIAGREVARGELVDIDGELGVRIAELVSNHHGGTS